MSNNSASKDVLLSTFYMSTIDVNLANNSRKVESITVKRNGESLDKTPALKCVEGKYQIEFLPSIVMEPDDCISVTINYAGNSGVMSVIQASNTVVDFKLRDVECMPGEQGTTVCRKKIKGGEVAVAGHQSLPPNITSIIGSGSQFRVLIIGNSGVGKSSLIQKVFGVEDVEISDTMRGAANIDREFISPKSDQFVIHDSLGFESGEERNLEIVKNFVHRRRSMPQLKDQLHAIWLCLEIPYCGARLFEEGAEVFLKRQSEVLGDVPLVVVLTKLDLLDRQMEIDVPRDETLDGYKQRCFKRFCLDPLYEVAEPDVTYITVSVQDEYYQTLSGLLKATDKKMTKFRVEGTSG